MQLLEAYHTANLLGLWSTIKKVEVPIHSGHSLIEVANKFLEFEKSSIEILWKHFE